MNAINVIRYPTGKYGFAGRVPVDLAYRITGGSCFDRRDVRDAIPQSGPGIARKIAGNLGVTMEAKAFDSAAEAFDVATAYVEAHGLNINVHEPVGE